MNVPHGWELILVLLVVVMVFGYKRLPDSARAVGRSMRILKAETKGLRDDDTPSSSTTASAVEPARPVTPAPPVPGTPPVASQPPAQPYVGQQLFDAQGNPVNAPSAGSSPVQPADQATRYQG